MDPAPFNAQSFRALVGGVDGSATLAFTRNQAREATGITANSRLIARFIARFRTAENNQLTDRFIGALRQQFGQSLTDSVITSSSLSSELGRGNPLRARHVAQLYDRTERARTMNRAANDGLIEAIGRAGDERAAPLPGIALPGEQIDFLAAKHYRENPTVAVLLDPDLIARKVQNEIRERSGDGRYRVTCQEVTDMMADMIIDDLDEAFRAARQRAIAALSLHSPNSVARLALAGALANHESPLAWVEDNLTTDALDAYSEALCKGIRRGHIAADRLDDTAALEAFAVAEANRLSCEREAARKQLDRLDLADDCDASARAALKFQLTVDSLPVQLVSPLARAYGLVKEDLARLGGRQSRVQLQKIIRRVSEAISEAFRQSGIDVSVENQNMMYVQAWRFLLAPGGESGAASILRQFQGSRSLLRDICEGANWYRVEFPSIQAWSRFAAVGNVESNPRSPDRRASPGSSASTPKDARHAVTVCSTLLLSLHTVVNEKLRTANRVVPLGCNAKPSDAAVAALRDLGVPFPAPDRVGRANRQVSLSKHQRREINAQLHDQLTDSARQGVDVFGLTKGCGQDLKRDHARYLGQQRRVGSGRACNRYYIDSDRCLPQDPDTVSLAMRRFCTEWNSRGEAAVNHELLRNVSAMAHGATFDSVHAACMDPARPELALMNGQIHGIVQHTSYRLSRTASNEPRLHLERLLRPCWYEPQYRCSSADVADGGANESGGDRPVSLNPTRSSFRTRIEVKFDPQTQTPFVYKVRLSYNLVEGIHASNAFPFYIPNPNRPLGDALSQ